MPIQTGRVPSDWKLSNVIPIFKSGRIYVYISFTNSVKIVGKNFHKQLIDHLENNVMQFSFLFCFRSKLSTELAVSLFTEHMRREAEKSSLTGAILIDLSLSLAQSAIQAL